MVNLFAVRIDQKVRAIDLTPLIQLVSDTRQARIMRYRNQEDMIRSLFAELLIRRVLCEHNIDYKNIAFSYNRYGKPTIMAPIMLEYNISHAGSWIVGAFSRLPVGIDVEVIKPINMVIAKRFFTAIESNQLEELPLEQQINRFYELWTLKESYIKAIGYGLSMPLNSFSVRFLSQEGTYQLKADNGDDDYVIKQLDLESDVRLALCAKEREINHSIQHWSTSDWI